MKRGQGKARLSAVVLAAVLLVLTGCSYGNAGVVAKINDHTLTSEQYMAMRDDSQVRQLITSDAQANNASAPKDLSNVVIRFFSTAYGMEGFASSRDQQIDPAQVNNSVGLARDYFAQHLGLPAAQLSPSMQLFIGWLVRQQLAANAVISSIDQQVAENPKVDPQQVAMGVERAFNDYLQAHLQVNPRYGAWDAAKGQLQPLFSGGLSSADLPTPTPQQQAPQQEVPQQQAPQQEVPQQQPSTLAPQNTATPPQVSGTAQ